MSAGTGGEPRRELMRMVASARSPVAVAVGSGLGNLIHTGPVIRRLAEHFGHRVDLIVAEDYDASLGLLHDPAVVGSVCSLRSFVLDRRWRLIFVTHSFGAARPPFAADAVVWSRDWDAFHPDHRLHEAVFNLEAARQLLGVDYVPADAARTVLEAGAGGRTPEPRLVGLHAGSKTGFWACKRWPLFEELAAALVAEGFAVASFGLPDEHVPGTIDRTGGSIEEMARAVGRCAAFVANDSGVMNIANALGVPLLALFAPTNWRTRGPLGGTSLSLALEKPCSPCELRDLQRLRSGACRCIAELSLERVLGAFRTLWAERERPVITNGTPRRI